MSEVSGKRDSTEIVHLQESSKKLRVEDSEVEPDVNNPLPVSPSAPMLHEESAFIANDNTKATSAPEVMSKGDDITPDLVRLESTMEVDQHDYDIVDEKFGADQNDYDIVDEKFGADQNDYDIVDEKFRDEFADVQKKTVDKTEDMDESEVEHELYRRLSDKLMSMDELDIVEADGDMDQTDGFDALSYLRHVADETRLVVAKYLSTGNLKDVKITESNVHPVYHVALGLNLKKLRTLCSNFCTQSDQNSVFVAFQGCSCYEDLKSECNVALTRSESILSNSGDSTPPEFYVVFTCDENDAEKQEKIKVVVIDMSERAKVLHRAIKKPFKFATGFRTCGCEIDQSPYVFFSGGTGKSNDIMWKYDVISGEWKKTAKLLHGRSKHAMIAPNEKNIYVLGGQEVPCIEEYDIAKNKWTERGSLLVHVDSSMYASYKNKIYIFGGKTVSGPVSTVQVFNISTLKVEKLPDLPCPMFGGKAVALGDRLFIASDQGHMVTFDPESGVSELCAMQPLVRADFGMFIRNERIYLVGGVLGDSDRKLESTPQYRYNPQKDEWVEKYKLCDSFRVLSASIVRYPKYCPIVPFNDHF